MRFISAGIDINRNVGKGHVRAKPPDRFGGFRLAYRASLVSADMTPELADGRGSRTSYQEMPCNAAQEANAVSETGGGRCVFSLT